MKTGESRGNMPKYSISLKREYIKLNKIANLMPEPALHFPIIFTLTAPKLGIGRHYYYQ